MILLFIQTALLNILRNFRRSFFTIFGIAVAVASTCCFYGFVQSTLHSLQESFARSGEGHIQIAKREWFDSYTKEKERVDGKILLQLKKLLQSKPLINGKINSFSLRRHIHGIISTDNSASVFQGFGIETKDYIKMSSMIYVPQGKYFSHKNPNEIMVGTVLADKLNMKPGDMASLLVNTDEGRINAVDVVLRGTLKSRSAELDAIFLNMPYDTSLDLYTTTLSDVLTIGLYDTAQTDFVLAKINNILNTHDFDTLAARPWYKMAVYYKKVRNLYLRIFLVVQVVLFLGILLSVINTVYMAISERRQEIGMLRAIGAEPQGVQKLFLWEGFFIGLFGAFFGVISAYITSIAVELSGGIPMPPPPGQSYGYDVFFKLDFTGVMVVAAFAILSTLVATYLPSRGASKENIARVISGN